MESPVPLFLGAMVSSELGANILQVDAAAGAEAQINKAFWHN